MAVARALYSDIKLINFTIAATSFPTQTQIESLMTALYEDAYGEMPDDYAAYNASEEHPIIDKQVCKRMIIQEAEEITQAWHMSSPQVPPPSSSLSPKGIYKLRRWLKKSPNRLTNIRAMGETWDDY